LVALMNAGCRETLGLEISPSATVAANEYLISQGLKGQAVVKEGDFFKDDVGTFDIGYDYTCVHSSRGGMRL
jgi:methylase of polypeptide subunit release factors